MHRHTKRLTYKGLPLEEATHAMIMVHGRGASHLEVEGFALLAPEAAAHTWYPYSFMAPVVQNEPGLSTGLGVLNQVVAEIQQAGIPGGRMYFLGFSQGACLAGEYLARNAQKFGGAFLYSGGLIGQTLDTTQYAGSFEGMPILLGCSDVDMHVPLERVKESTRVFSEMGAQVTERIYPNAPHSIFEDEINLTNELLLSRNTAT